MNDVARATRATGEVDGTRSLDASRETDRRTFDARARCAAPMKFDRLASDTEAVKTWGRVGTFAAAGAGASTVVLTSRAEETRGGGAMAFIKADCDVREDGTFEEACERIFMRGERVYARAECTESMAVASGVDAVASIFGEPVKLKNCGVWFGAASNVTPLHYDLCHGFLIQIKGVKTFTVFHPDDFRAMYQRPGRPELSRVNLTRWYAGDAAEREKFPDFEDATPMVFTLYPGDVLYTPPFFWHHVRTHEDEPAISVLVPFDMSGDERVHVCHLY